MANARVTQKETAVTTPPSGATLKERLAWSEKIFEETGHYKGLQALPLKETNPVLFERVFTRLRSTVVMARETARRLAASPGVREVGELLFGIYTPEGDAIVLSTGILVHVHSISRFIKWMIRNDYEIDPGFRPGDIFANNDTFIGSVHVPDVMDVIPIFHEGALVGWVGAVCHELEVGGITAGGDVAAAQERFTEGLFVCAEKVGENDDLRRDYVIRCERNLREPAYWIMDEKARISACLEIRDRVLALIGDLGVETYSELTAEFIEDTRRTQLERVRTMCVPGRYRAPSFYGHVAGPGQRLLPLSPREMLIHVPLEVVIDETGHLILDFEGASPWAYHSMNCTPTAMEGGLFVTLTQSMGFDGKANHGLYLATTLKLPPGTWTNPDNELVATATAWALLLIAYGGLQRVLSRSLYARGFLEEIFVGQVNTPMVEIGGISQYGRPFGCAHFECGAGGSGARGIIDGLDTGYAGWNPESDMGNAEIWEQAMPLLYLGRLIDGDSGGYGRFRGGVAFQSLWKIHGTPHVLLATSEHSARVFDNAGVFGGYPASTIQHHYVLRSVPWQRLLGITAPVPRRAEDHHGEMDSTLAIWAGESSIQIADGAFLGAFGDGDIFSHSYNSGGGFGDPLRRDPVLCLRDVQEGKASREMTERVYGVIIAEGPDGGFHVDDERTVAMRASIRSGRLARSVPVAEWYARERSRILRSDLAEPVRRMYSECKQLSPRWWEEFRVFWNLPSDFNF